MLANNKFGSTKIFDFLIFLKDLNAKIAIGNSVHPNIIFWHFFLISSLTAGLIAFSANLILPILTSLIDLFTLLTCNLFEGLINSKYLSKYL